MSLVLRVHHFWRRSVDVINYCLKGFKYRFESLSVEKKPNELSKAFSTLFHSNNDLDVIQILQAVFPIFRIIVSCPFVSECPLTCMYATT